ncbi:hypothetical protein [Acidipropionibacterium virtanenii]|uniref:Uncharacterized protein n=1 Tax=Acidipropionibacterium virtanenii TaxID=2057246 RepID=A0A344UXQ2_9ACTN|nr:hypothetical protein [Acidipropionibacterium virtanenii]AXE40050.1 hypothetical protein JS278_02916 [Acidipropionibacterium virtanenii]
MMPEEFDVERRWPDLFDKLGGQQRRSVAQALEEARAEGREVTRQEVADLIEETRGTIGADEYTRKDMPPR